MLRKEVGHRQFEMAWKFIKAKMVTKVKRIERNYGSLQNMQKNRLRYSLMMLGNTDVS